MADGYHAYLASVQERLARARADDIVSAIDHAAELISSAINDGRVLYVFGASHAGLLVQDLFYRAGGLVPIEPILPGGLMLNERPIRRTSALEQTPGVAAAILSDCPLGANDVLLVVSVSGRNPVPVEMCLTAQERGATVIALTSLEYSTAVTGRGVPRLAEVADVVIDLPAPVGDAVVPVADGAPATGPVSSALGTAMLHGLMTEVCMRIVGTGAEPPIFASANLDDAERWNRKVIERYRSRVSYL